MVKNFSPMFFLYFIFCVSPKAVVSDKLGPVTNLVQIENGDFWKRHLDHLHVASDKPPLESPTGSTPDVFPFFDTADNTDVTEEAQNSLISMS